jgi:hypothetical protein
MSALTGKNESDGRAFVADVRLPERRRMWITHTGIQKSSFGAAEWLGWSFVVSTFGDGDEERPLADRWEMTFLEILRYPEEYSEKPIQWRRQDTGENVCLRGLQPQLDASRYYESCVKSCANPDENLRMCFNRYDDGSIRFILEREVRENGLSAWEPLEWSAPHDDLAGAENEALNRFAWAK